LDEKVMDRMRAILVVTLGLVFRDETIQIQSLLFSLTSWRVGERERGGRKAKRKGHTEKEEFDEQQGMFDFCA
jgi:hypothetical protein